MAENTETTTQENTSETKPEVKTFTQEDVDRIVQERLARSKKSEKKQANEPTEPSEQATQQASELEALRQENAKLTKQIADAEHAQAVNKMHLQIATKYGISDPSILVGDNEEEAEAFAKKLLAVFKPYENLATARSKQATNPTKKLSPREDFERVMRNLTQQ
ncbi:capsid assembly scaffolding protein Gp46 family protein [Aeriscardovia aeriphila]|uniref:Scaffolding protein n=1 Tax=Aeriscardovia aeriphila TaxID=218139 RepID=A0A261FAS0_9BIFI|nr:DUF4355 domain-containing protein [Aeriscardovia aeriphila]NYI25787.1 ribosomal protein L20A (L18A) [Aeriscardovia aeriphila]OZG56063.1 scaffolding protein [Aeriscardovia aeriphila]